MTDKKSSPVTSLWQGQISLSRIVFALAITVFAAALRLWPLGLLGQRTMWLTFYPAVMVAALYGGFLAGIIGTVFSCLITVFLWPIFVPTPFIKDLADWITLIFFSFTSTMISIVVESMRRAKTKASKALEEAEKANKAKSIFLANMSHELRTPLNAILGYSRIVHDSPEIGAQNRNYLQIVTHSGENLLELINNILDIAKMESGRVPLEETVTDFFQVIEETRSLLYIRAADKKLYIKVEFSTDLPRTILVDGGKLRRVLINLVGNAIKFTPSGGVVIRSRVLERKADDFLSIRVEVQDTGPGISEKDRGGLFQPFVQSTASQSTKGEGTGLGLAICRQNIDSMGGTIDVSSEVGKGSVFYFDFPAHVVPDEAYEVSKLENKLVVVSNADANRRILIAEDHPDNRMLLNTLLKRVGLDVCEAENGEQALRLAADWHPELIFMDIRMPVMDGLTATKLLKANPTTRDIKIIALTAHALEQERAQILLSGCDGFIRKPYRENEIWGELKKHLGITFTTMASSSRDNKKGVELADDELDLLPISILLEIKSALELLDVSHGCSVVMRLMPTHSILREKLLTMISEMKFSDLLEIFDRKTGGSDHESI